MKVILLNDVKKVGKKGDVVEVSDGYGRNFLLKNHHAVLATKKGMEILDEENLQNTLHEKQLKSDAEKLKQELEKIELSFHVKSGENGKVFGSVSSKAIIDKLKSEFNIVIDKKKITGHIALSALGYHDVEVNLYRNQVMGVVRVHIHGSENV